MRLITGMGNAGSYIPMMALPAAWFAAKGGLPQGSSLLEPAQSFHNRSDSAEITAAYGADGWRYAWYLPNYCDCMFFICAAQRTDPEQRVPQHMAAMRRKKTVAKFTLFSAWCDKRGEKEIWNRDGLFLCNGYVYRHIDIYHRIPDKEVGSHRVSRHNIRGAWLFLQQSCGVIWGAF